MSVTRRIRATSVAPNNSDRRRFLLATGLTLLALPALWWANRATDSRAPNVATVGVDVGTGANGVAVAAAPAVAATPTNTDAPVFLGGPSAPGEVAPAEIAVPTSPEFVSVATDATYSSEISPSDSCLVFGVQTGTALTVVNLDNGRSITCTATRTFVDRDPGIVMHTDMFSKIADLTDAPVPVEIRQ